MRRVIVKDAAKLTPSERKSCFAMSYKSKGDLATWLTFATDPVSVGDKVVLVKDGGVILGWAYRKRNGDVGFWTKRAYRKQGIGTLMVEKTKTLGRIKTHPHDIPSAKLFNKTNSLSNPAWKRAVKIIEGRNG